MLNKCYRNYRKSFVQFEYSKITKLRNILCFFISRLFFQTKYTKKKQAIRLAGIHSTYIQYFSVIVNDIRNFIYYSLHNSPLRLFYRHRRNQYKRRRPFPEHALIPDAVFLPET